MVFQNYALFPHLTVRENIAFGLQMRAAAQGRDRAAGRDEALRLVRLDEHADKLPGQLSGGQQQRVAIARAVVLEPPLVLMDEPLSNLDAKLRLEMRTEIRRLHQSLGLTTVYVTHDQEEALSLADRLVVLRDGRVQQIGTPEELYTRPANWHVADFMGYRNLLPLTGRSAVDGDAVTVDGRRLRAAPARRWRRSAPGDDVVAAIRPEDSARRPRTATPIAGDGRGRRVPGPRAGGRGAHRRRQPAAPADRRAARARRPGHARRRPAAAAGLPPTGRRPTASRMPGGAAVTAPRRTATRCGTGSPSAASTGSCCCCCPALLFVLALFVYPFLYGAGALVPADARAGAFGDYRQFFSDPYQRDTIWTTLQLALPAALLNVLAVGADRLPDARPVPRQAAADHAAGRADHARHGADRRGPAELPRPDRLVQPDPAGRSAWSTSRCG